MRTGWAIADTKGGRAVRFVTSQAELAKFYRDVDAGRVPLTKDGHLLDVRALGHKQAPITVAAANKVAGQLRHRRPIAPDQARKIAAQLRRKGNR